MRLFIAIELDQAVKQTFSKLPHTLQVSSTRIRWLTDEQQHLTLKFLGEVPDERLAPVYRHFDSICQAIPPFDLTVVRLGCFPERGPVRIIWVGLENASPVLFECYQQCEEQFEHLGFPREQKKVVPHITIGRVKEDASQGVLRHLIFSVNLKIVHQDVKSLTLLSSTLRKEGAHYEVLRRGRLGKA